jgi:hypothetical protein
MLAVTDIPLAKADKEVKASFWQNGEVQRKPEQAVYLPIGKL